MAKVLMFPVSDTGERDAQTTQTISLTIPARP